MTETRRTTEMRVVDQAERERIRSGLKRYKELHRIGDPDLRERMENQDILVPLRSLQRFIAGTHRTADIMVWRYAKFLSIVAPPPVEDRLGAALAKFIAIQPEDKDWSSGFAATYRTFARPHGPPPQESKAAAATAKITGTQHSQTAAFKETRSLVKLERAGDPSFMRVTELMIDPHLKEVSKPKQWLGNTGVFAPIGDDRYLLMVRSFLELRCYHLKKVMDAPLTLHGHAMQTETPFSRMQIPPWQPVSEFIMSAVPNESAKKTSA